MDGLGLVVVVAWSVVAVGLRFNGETKGLWMPRESTRRLLAAGGEGMILKVTLVLVCWRCKEQSEGLDFEKVWRGHDDQAESVTLLFHQPSPQSSTIRHELPNVLASLR